MHGHPLHTRAQTIALSAQPDGGWRARGDITDLRKCGFVPMSDDIQPAGIIHQMAIEIRVDPHSRRIGSIAVEQPVVAVEPSESSGGESCRDPAPLLQQLVGEALDADFPRRLSKLFGGPRGCSHLLTLFQLMGSALPRALALEPRDAVRAAGEMLFRRALFLDGHEIDDGRVGIGIQLSDFFTRPRSAVESPLERLAVESNARVYAVVERPALSIGEIRAATREKTASQPASWSTLDAEVAEFVGRPLMGGMAALLLGRFGGRPERALLLDSLLQLAPGYIQVMAAMLERWLAPSAEAGLRLAEESAAGVGGTIDSCYVWRSGGCMASRRPKWSNGPG